MMELGRAGSGSAYATRQALAYGGMHGSDTLATMSMQKQIDNVLPMIANMQRQVELDRREIERAVGLLEGKLEAKLQPLGWGGRIDCSRMGATKFLHMHPFGCITSLSLSLHRQIQVSEQKCAELMGASAGRSEEIERIRERVQQLDERIWGAAKSGFGGAAFGSTTSLLGSADGDIGDPGWRERAHDLEMQLQGVEQKLKLQNMEQLEVGKRNAAKIETTIHNHMEKLIRDKEFPWL